MTNNIQDAPLFRFFNEVGIIEQLARAKFESVLPDGLKISQFSVLNHLVRLGGDWSPARLANAFQVTRGAMTNTLQRLESRGLVNVASDPGDGRGKLVSLTASGREMRDHCIRNTRPFLENLEAEFGQKCFINALPLLEEVRKYLDQNRT